MTLVAGVDSSTQNCKVVLRDAGSGALVRSGRAGHPPGTEVDPVRWWEAMRAAFSRAGGLDEVAAISVAGQQHGLIPLDSAGRVIRPALLWNDTRSAAAARDLVGEVGAGPYARRAGSVPVASFTAAKLRWLRDHEPGNAAEVAAVALPHDWLTWRLRGFGPAASSPLGPELGELVTDRSEASGTAYWNPFTGEYDQELLERALGRAVIVPRVLGPGERAGTAAGTPIVVGPGAGDNAAAALGLDAARGDVVVSIGTSGTVFAVTDRPACDETGTVAGFADATGQFLPLIATLNAARVLDAVARLLDVGHDELGLLALDSPPGAGGLVLQPYFEGERTPNLPDATATLFGLTLASATRPALARAAFEGMLCGLADGLDAIRAQGVKADRVLLIGGAAQNTAVQRIAAQTFEPPVVVPRPGEYVADGAAAQAAWALMGERPHWPRSVAAEPPPDHRPLIREQYARHAPPPTAQPL
ncbi:FGGY family carbohydrate kinase [Nonomuraea sp. 3-1Str]|uniref:xylulokinase n=1 Tax=Nonomuraea sp. 3-1Str TaxID=2929801 RepID=UPI00285454A7|nr:FGGY family carbohydrate kinase [Nonomuraea sp. 3-1Str]MDR8413163.1 FGGY family carbohydrate kinase [Nonomuraea sp. 3-1Str]